MGRGILGLGAAPRASADQSINITVVNRVIILQRAPASHAPLATAGAAARALSTVPRIGHRLLIPPRGNRGRGEARGRRHLLESEGRHAEAVCGRKKISEYSVLKTIKMIQSLRRCWHELEGETTEN